jgi:hypothetical protein
MQVRYKFFPDDFEGSGQMIIRNSFPIGSTDFLFGISVAYKIGYVDFSSKSTVMISLADGMVSKPKTLEELCNELNNDELGYRPMTEAEIENILGEQGNRF